MPRITPDLQSADANTPVYPKGRYQVKVVSHRPRVFENADGDLRACVTYRMEMVGQYDTDGDLITEGFEGRPVADQTLWLHAPKAASMNKQFIMAAAGFGRDEEPEANEWLAQFEDWIDGEPGRDDDTTCGDLYGEIEGRLVDVYLDTDIYNDREQQKFAGWSPVK